MKILVKQELKTPAFYFDEKTGDLLAILKDKAVFIDLDEGLFCEEFSHTEIENKQWLDEDSNYFTKLTKKEFIEKFNNHLSFYTQLIKQIESEK